MDRFQVLTATAAPLLRDNVDTDIIIRIERLTAAVHDLRRWGFEALRYLPDGSDNPDFVLNQAPYRDAKIFLGGHNFGCGSSREGAVTAMMAMGLRSVIASSFGDIFFANCFQNGMLPVVLPTQLIESIASEVVVDPSTRLVTVDLFRQLVISPLGAEYPFEIAALRKESLLEGLDEISLTRKREPEIAAFQKRDHERRPWIYHPLENQS